MSEVAESPPPLLEVEMLEMRYGERLIQRHIDFQVEAGTIFAIIGGSGTGKSTLLRHLIGLQQPASGSVRFHGIDYWRSDEAQQQRLRQKFGVLFQSSALWSSMKVLDNVMLPLKLSGMTSSTRRQERAKELLGWVGLESAFDLWPTELSGGMKKRAALARAIAAEPDILFLDEPSAGLDPISSKRLDNVVLDLRQRTGAAVIVVSHELPSLMDIADDGIFLDSDSLEPIAHGSPKMLKNTATHPTVKAFLHRELPPDPDEIGVPESSTS